MTKESETNRKLLGLPQYTLEDFRRDIKNKYTSIGTYPIAFLTANGMLCWDCAKSEKEKHIGLFEEDNPDILSSGVNWEDDELYCNDCSGKIEKAY